MVGTGEVGRERSLSVDEGIAAVSAAGQQSEAELQDINNRIAAAEAALSSGNLQDIQTAMANLSGVAMNSQQAGMLLGAVTKAYEQGTLALSEKQFEQISQKLSPNSSKEDRQEAIESLKEAARERITAVQGNSGVTNADREHAADGAAVAATAKSTDRIKHITEEVEAGTLAGTLGLSTKNPLTSLQIAGITLTQDTGTGNFGPLSYLSPSTAYDPKYVAKRDKDIPPPDTHT